MKIVLLFSILFWLPLQAEIVDRMVAVVGDDVITWSDLRAEAAYEAFLHGQPPPPQSPAEINGAPKFVEILSRRVDQTLLQQERERYAFTPPQNGGTERRLQQIRDRFRDSEAYQEALRRYGLTEAKLRQRLERERTILAFIQYRLRPRVRLDSARVEEYYNEVLLPELERQGVKSPPPLAEVRDQIEQIRIQQEIDRLLEEWVQQLRNRTKIRILLGR